jgi:uncharacterized membrane protein YhiD involved in acid resistance
MKNTKLINIAGVTAALVLAVFLAGYFLSQNRIAPAAAPAPAAEKAADSPSDLPFFSQITAAGQTNAAAAANADAPLTAPEIILRLFLSVILAAILAFRPRKNVPLFRRNLYVAQTQILLAVVAAALMMIVGDNAARAFAIFAAVSLVRFRTNIRDPKEITVLLISLALGLAAGVGRWDLGLVLCLFALLLLAVLEYNEPEQVFRSMALTVKTRDTELTQDLLKTIFDRYKLEAEVREIDPPDESNPVGRIMYYLNLRLNLSTDFLSERIFASDTKNIEGIQWEQKKDASYIYQ